MLESSEFDQYIKSSIDYQYCILAFSEQILVLIKVPPLVAQESNEQMALEAGL